MARSVDEAKLRKKEYDRRRREQIKSDPEKLAELREKERLKYQKKREKGVLNAKLVKNMSEREHRKITKEWRKRSKRYRDQKKEEKKLNLILQQNTPPSSPLMGAAVTPESTPASKPSDSTSRRNAGRKRVKNSRSKMYRTIMVLRENVKKSNRSAEKYKKRYERLKKKMIKRRSPLSPNSSVTRFLGKEKVSQDIRRKLVFGEVVTQQLKENIKNISGHKNTRLYFQNLNCSVFKKYKQVSAAKKAKIINTKSLKSCYKDILPRGRCLPEALKKNVQDFFERDDITRMTAGKKEYISFKKEKKQKRYLLDSMISLHEKFLSTAAYHLSYQSFCRLKPFWVIKPKVDDRDTCACKKHLNFEYIVTALANAKVIEPKSSNELIKGMCCKQMDSKCLLRECMNCKHQNIQAGEFTNKLVPFSQWTTVSTKVVIKGTEKTIKKSTKTTTPTALVEIYNKLHGSLNDFLTHSGNIFHQYNEISSLKSSLGLNEVLFHIDFSQNYECKFEQEIQSFHFGGSRTQITLHTGVLYLKDKSGIVTPHSFCTFATSLCHDYNGIWAHLKPVFNWLKTLTNEEITTIHFLSDGPFTQYKNKYMFYIISNFLTKFVPNIKYSSWNYSESGHGKGAPDGIGGRLKSMADQVVAEGRDVSDITSLIGVLKEKCPGIYLTEVTEDEIQEVKTLFSMVNLQSFSGTQNVHQVVYNSNDPYLYFNKLSCFRCFPDVMPCIHYHIGKCYPRENDNIKSGSLNSVINTWVAVVYDNQWLPGMIKKKNGENIFVHYMKSIGPNRFIWPNIEDTDMVNLNSILCFIKGMPELTSSAGRVIYSLVENEYHRITNLFLNLE